MLRIRRAGKRSIREDARETQMKEKKIEEMTIKEIGTLQQSGGK